MITGAHISAISIALFLASMFNPSNSMAADAEGSGSATFINPTPSSAVVSGIGTSGFSWGIPISGSSSSNLSFSGQTFMADFDRPFSVGTLGYFNGTINLGTQADSVDMVVLIQISMPRGGDQSFTQTLTLINTPNTSDPVASGDIVRLPTSIPEIKFDVGGIEHTLRIEGFGTISGAGGASSIDRFFVLEEGSASAELIASISPVCPESEGFQETLQPVPGPDGGMLRYKANITKGFGGDAVGVAVTLCNPNPDPVKLVMCSMANQDAPEVSHDLRNAVFNGGVWSCPSAGTYTSVPSYHFGCQRLEIAPGEKKAVFNDGGILGSTKRLAPYIDFLRDGPVDPSCATDAPSGIRGANQFLNPIAPISTYVNIWTIFDAFAELSPQLGCTMNWPAGNWLTMGNPDTYFAQLQGTVFNAPTGTTLRLRFPPGSPNEEVTFTVDPSNPSNPTCLGEPVQITESFVIPPEPATLALQVELTEECSENLRESTVMRFNAEVVGDDVPDAPVYAAGDFIYENSGSCVVDNTPPEILDITTIPQRDGTIRVNVAARDEITQPIEAALTIRVNGQDQGLVDMRYDDPPVEGDTVFFQAEIGPFPEGATVEIEPIVADDGGLIGSLPTIQLGDLDNDGDVDRDDISIIIGSRNQIADPLDPRDIDGDGTITALDARKITQLCTRPRCATE